MESLVPLLSVVWMGIVCAVSPCPLATNIVAVSFLSREAERPSRVLWGGLFYALGRTVTCVGVAVAILFGLAAAPTLSQVLQKYMGLALGPLLIVVGAVLLDLISLPKVGPRFDLGRLGARFSRAGGVGAFALGLVFALVLCPPSAAVYFGGLLPLAESEGHPILYPLVFGLMTALPVVAVAIACAFGLKGLGAAFAMAQRFDGILRKGTGSIILALGLWKSISLLMP
ncbi:MAG: aromatic aminobenezylarsenical efflux permease ArsG family transporter [bacterium]|nr:aromatic aminobenezylarsenical efflux permease ArsG family transporter [bacterium]